MCVVWIEDLTKRYAASLNGVHVTTYIEDTLEEGLYEGQVVSV